MKKIRKIEEKSWKEGTYAFTKYYVNGRLFHEMSEPKNKCGVSYFSELPTSERKAKKEDITSNTPYFIDNMLEEMGYE